VLPLLVVAADRWLVPAGTTGPTRPHARPLRLWPWFAAVLAVWWALRSLVFDSVAGGIAAVAVAGEPLPWSRHLLAPLELFGQHVLLLVWPWPLSPFRPFAADGAPAQLAAGLAGAVLWLALAVAARRTRSRGLAFAAALLALTLLPPALRWQQLGSWPVADRYLYPGALATGLVAAAVATRRRWLRWLPPLLTCAAAVFARGHVQVFADQSTLVAHGRAMAPLDATLQVMQGDLALRRAEAGDAAALRIAHSSYTAAVQNAPAATAANRVHRARPAALLGLAWCEVLARGAQRRAADDRVVDGFRRAVDADPSLAAAWIGLGTAHAMAGGHDAAARAFAQALALAPHSAEAWYALAHLHEQRGQRADAKACAERALHEAPGHAPALALLARVR
jgi:tetratricopeptide (TPR) repeat protein